MILLYQIKVKTACVHVPGHACVYTHICMSMKKDAAGHNRLFFWLPQRSMFVRDGGVGSLK